MTTFLEAEHRIKNYEILCVRFQATRCPIQGRTKRGERCHFRVEKSERSLLKYLNGSEKDEVVQLILWFCLANWF